MSGRTSAKRSPAASALRGAVAILLLLPFPLLASAADARENPGYSLAVHTVYGEPEGPRAVHEMFVRELIHRLSSLDCFSRVERVASADAPDADLLLEVTLDRFHEEVIFQASVSQRADPLDPAVRRQLVAKFAVDVYLELRYAPEKLALDSHVRRVRTSVRPLMPGHEEQYARNEARRQGISDMVQETAAKVCKGSRAKLAKRIAKARQRREPRSAR